MSGNEVNWIVAFNRLFAALNKVGAPTYCKRSNFLDMVRKVDPDCLTYSPLMDERKRRNLSQSRKDYFRDLIEALTKPQKFSLFRLFIDGLEPFDKEAADSVRDSEKWLAWFERDLTNSIGRLLLKFV